MHIFLDCKAFMIVCDIQIAVFLTDHAVESKRYVFHVN
jgi:hypothetical protein